MSIASMRQSVAATLRYVSFEFNKLEGPERITALAGALAQAGEYTAEALGVRSSVINALKGSVEVLDGPVASVLNLFHGHNDFRSLAGIVDPVETTAAVFPSERGLIGTAYKVTTLAFRVWCSVVAWVAPLGYLLDKGIVPLERIPVAMQPLLGKVRQRLFFVFWGLYLANDAFKWMKGSSDPQEQRTNTLSVMRSSLKLALQVLPMAAPAPLRLATAVAATGLHLYLYTPEAPPPSPAVAVA